MGYPSCWIGSDEVGKGDYLGPLVVAAVCLKAGDAAKAGELGIKDSKKVTDKKALALAKEIEALWPAAVVMINPSKYNELQQKMKNINKLLTWAHGQALANLLDKGVHPEAWVVDQFGDEEYLRREVERRAKGLKLIQRVRAEDDPAVAAASVLARAYFLRRMDSLSKEFGVTLHKGAGTPTDASAQAFVAKHGVSALGNVAKLHFKNTQRVG